MNVQIELEDYVNRPAADLITALLDACAGDVGAKVIEADAESWYGDDARPYVLIQRRESPEDIEAKIDTTQAHIALLRKKLDGTEQVLASIRQLLG